jgi:hypothetical protein
MHAHLQAYDSATAERLLFLFVANGVTTIRNMDYLPFPPLRGTRGGGDIAKLGGPTLLGLRARTATGALLGPRIYTSAAWGGGFPGDIPSMLKVAHGERPSHETQEQVDTLVARYKAAGYDFIKVHDEDSTLYAYLVNAAQRVGIPVAGHVPAGMSLEQVLAAHQHSIEHLTGYEDHPDFSSNIPKLVAATKRAGVWNCPTLTIDAENDKVLTPAAVAQWPERRYYTARARHLQDALATDWHADSVAALQQLIAQRQLVKALQDSGAGLLLGTDTPAGTFVPGFAVHHELEALVAAGLTPYQALATGTKNVAAYFGTERESGTIAVGKRADLVLLDGNPLTDIRQTSQISGVMVGGRWLPRAALDHRLAGYVGTLDDPIAQIKDVMRREARQLLQNNN